MLLSKAAKDEFGLTADPRDPHHQELDEADVAAMRSMVRRMYAETQAHFAELGITKLSLMRGIKSPVRTRNALESWTSSEKTAKKFGTYAIIEADVDVARVLAFSKGPGWKNGPRGEEFEYLLMAEVPQ